MKKLTICMYGAASDRIATRYIEEVEKLGQTIAEHGHTLIYGGGASGLMGAVARGVSMAGGQVIGVVPDFMNHFEPIFDGCTQVIRTETMSDRKKVMEDNADAFVIVPGGIGTYDEFFQVLTLVELERKKAPIVVFNVDGYYDTMIRMIQEGIQKGFIRKTVSDLFVLADDAEQVIEKIQLAP